MMLHKDYESKGTAAKKKTPSGHEPQEAKRQDELIRDKQPVVK
jgi:hypothetical protein